MKIHRRAAALGAVLTSLLLFALPVRSNAAEPVVLGYYADWTQWTLAPSAIPFENVTHLAHAFIWPDTAGNLQYESYFLPSNPSVAAHAAGVKVLVAIGGYTRSTAFPTVAASATARANFIQNVTQFVLANGYDGVDLDWEFPQNSTDRGNLNTLVRELRQHWQANGHDLLLTMAVNPNPYYGQWIDFATLSAYVDWFGAMTYDYHGGWSAHTGHNAPLWSDARDPDAAGSVHSSIAGYLMGQRGLSGDKIVAGIPFYGRVFNGATAPYSGYTWVSDIAYRDVLARSGDQALWDATAAVPYRSNTTANQFITYDDEQSVTLKARYALDQQLRGAMIWEISHDRLGNGTHPLLAAVAAELRTVTPVEPPAAPGHFAAGLVESERVPLAWSDLSNNEQRFEIERTTVSGGVPGSWEQVATPGANLTAWTDLSVSASTTYRYRLRAVNSAGASVWVGPVEVTTPAPPPWIDHLAAELSLARGSASTTAVEATHAQDGSVLRLSESVTGGSPSKRRSELSATLRFDVRPGKPITVFLNAWAPANVENDRFRVEGSVDGTAFIPLFTVNAATADALYQTATLDPSQAGSVWVRIVDTDRTAGYSRVDFLDIDHLFVRTETAGGGGGGGGGPEGTLHLGSFTGTSEVFRKWQAHADLLVHAAGETPLAGAVVTVGWSNGGSGSGSCTTGSDGRCRVSLFGLRTTVPSVTATVTGIAHPGMQWDTGSDHVPMSIEIRQ